MSWVPFRENLEAKTMFGLAPPEVTGRFLPLAHEEATRVDRPGLHAVEPEGLLAFDDDVTAPYYPFDLDPTEVDQTPLHP